MNEYRRTKHALVQEIQALLQAMKFQVDPAETASMNFHSLSDWQANPSQIQVTISIGAAALYPEQDSLLELLARADRALYTAKETSRNRVCLQGQI